MLRSSRYFAFYLMEALIFAFFISGVSKLWLARKSGPLPDFINKVVLEHIYLHIVSGCVHATVAELSLCNRDIKPISLKYLLVVICRKNLLNSGLDPQCIWWKLLCFCITKWVFQFMGENLPSFHKHFIQQLPCVRPC